MTVNRRNNILVENRRRNLDPVLERAKAQPLGQKRLQFQSQITSIGKVFVRNIFFHC